MLTRRTMGRFFLFRPDPDSMITRIIVFCLAVVAAKLGTLVHCVCAMSTHIHLVVTDTGGV